MEATASHVLLLDNDANVCNQLGDYLGQNNIQVTAVNTGAEVLQVIGREPIDLLLIELGLHGEDGLRLTGNIRASSAMPIVVLSRLIDEADRVMGLELGADDYVTKPFSPRELLARIRAVLRRYKAGIALQGREDGCRAFRFSGWELNVRMSRLKSPEGRTVQLSRCEYGLLHAFVSAPQQILSRDQLIGRTRLHGADVYDRSIDVQIMRLRRKIEADPSRPHLIRTERGAGYYFDAPVAVLR